MEPENLLHLCKSLPPLPILSQISPVHDLPTDLFKISFNLLKPKTYILYQQF